SVANPDKKVIGLVGDGGLMLGIGEIATMVQENTNMVLMIMNDPEGLLGDKNKTEYGITCALIPASHAGVKIGARHYPGSPFM
ncbi:thiamine pyrophosphate-dependent enzyme, partial [Acinetobacter nosocomialis]|uniref:thiamine pyrophosphate-dependent enzyme n=1 Tax=Acinetobacter nosocomialis TaxID=106654 RepID=UPI002091C42A